MLTGTLTLKPALLVKRLNGCDSSDWALTADAKKPMQVIAATGRVFVHFTGTLMLLAISRAANWQYCQQTAASVATARVDGAHLDISFAVKLRDKKAARRI